MNVSSFAGLQVDNEIQASSMKEKGDSLFMEHSFF